MPLNQTARLLAATAPQRHSVVTYRKSYLRNPLEWQLRLRGQPVGGYAYVDDLNSYDPTASYASREDADRAGEIWIATGVLPAHQRDLAA